MYFVHVLLFIVIIVAKSKSKSNPPVKFSADKDLEADECLSLLDKYTPPHMKGNKTTQKLFVQ